MVYKQGDLFIPSVAEIKISYVPSSLFSNRIKINSSKDAARVLFHSWDKNLIHLQEQFVVLYINQANQVLGKLNLSTGGINSTLVDLRILFAVAVKSLSSGIIVAHNHPSGNKTPSKVDNELIKKISASAKLLNIRLLDGLIITPESEHDYFSYADEGLL